MLGIAMVFAASACVSTQAVRLGTGPIRAPIAADKVTIYRTSDQVKAKYEEIALLSSSGDNSMTSEEALYASMRKKAAEMGANGIILQSVEDAGTGAKLAHAILGTSADRKGKAIAIFVFPASADSADKKP